MAIQDYEENLIRCARCSHCKWIPPWAVNDARFVKHCPSSLRYSFDAYSAQGRGNIALGMLRDVLSYETSESLLDIVYTCQTCGACDVTCKVIRDLEPLEVLYELRAKCVEDGQLLPAHTIVIESLRKDDNVMSKPKAERGKWAEGLDVKDITKEKADILFHAGCQYSFDEELWEVARKAVNILRTVGVDLGIMGGEETCCGGRAYELGYQGEHTKYAEHNIETWNVAGVGKVVTPCADCLGAFRLFYPRIGKEMNFEVLHVTQYIDQLIKEGKIKFGNRLPIKVTYHDPCHLGRGADPYIPWEGKVEKVLGQLPVTVPRKERRYGRNGIYDPPREILRSIPGLELVEMWRIREYSFCCGAGGGVKEAYPDFALWTAKERIMEAKATGAEALVTACPWCTRNFKDAMEEYGEKIELYDVIDLVTKAIGG